VWRAVSINKGFVADEWDFNFGDVAAGSKVTYHSKKTGKTFEGTYAVGAAIDKSVEKFGAFAVTITLSTGEVLKGLFNDQWTGPITKFMFLGLPTKSGDTTDHSFDHSMELEEFVLISCLPGVKNCDFSPTPHTPTPTPTPAPSPSSGQCCFGGCSGGNCQGGWCGQSQSQCEANCKGKWCPKITEVVV
jgi:hypothetical protein